MEHCLYLLLSQSLEDMVVVTVVAVAVVTVVTVVTMMSVMTMMVPMALLHNDHLRLRLNYHFLRWVSGLIALLRRLNVHLLGRVSGLSDDVASLSSHAVASTGADYDSSRLDVAVLKKSQNREEINGQTAHRDDGHDDGHGDHDGHGCGDGGTCPSATDSSRTDPIDNPE
jgi:hypothetical protein